MPKTKTLTQRRRATDVPIGADAERLPAAILTMLVGGSPEPAPTPLKQKGLTPRELFDPLR
jgi:hypothetical protein